MPEERDAACVRVSGLNESKQFGIWYDRNTKLLDAIVVYDRVLRAIHQSSWCRRKKSITQKVLHEEKEEEQ